MLNKTFLIPAVLIVIVFLGVIVAAEYYFKTNHGDGIACTLEAKLCPDGSAVGRTGPNCEFAACPSATTTATSTTGGSGGILPYTSGISGQILLGPTCPVEHDPPDPNCADKPYVTLVAIFRANDPTHAFAFTKSNVNGQFKISLPPGTYAISAGESTLPRCAQVQTSVAPNVYTNIAISCDTGIR